MTVYSGKDAKVYLESYQLPYVSDISLQSTRRRLLFQDYHGNVIRYRGKPLVQGLLTMHDVGMPYLLHFMPYKTVESGSLVGEWDNELYSIGFPFPAECSVQATIYNGQSRETLFDIPVDVALSGITWKDIHIYIDGVGTPNSAVYTVQLIEGGSNIRDTETFTWTTNTPRWVSLSTILHDTSISGTWRVRVYTSDAGTNISNCQRIYSHSTTGTYYPLFHSSGTTRAVMCEIEDWKATEQKVNMTLEVSTNYTALLSGVVFGETGKVYSASSLQPYTITYTADSVKWIET